MDVVVFQDLAMQSVETLRRAAARGLRDWSQRHEQATVVEAGVEALRERLTDLEADTAVLRVLRSSAEQLLREAMESDAFLRFCEAALQAAELTLNGLNDVAPAIPHGKNVERVEKLFAETRALGDYFRRLAAWLRTSPPQLPRGVLEKLEAIPPVASRAS